VTGATGIIAGGLANFFSLAAFSYAFPVCFFPFYDQVCALLFTDQRGAFAMLSGQLPVSSLPALHLSLNNKWLGCRRCEKRARTIS
jgi:hypothetical protein